MQRSNGKTLTSCFNRYLAHRGAVLEFRRRDWPDVRVLPGLVALARGRQADVLEVPDRPLTQLAQPGRLRDEAIDSFEVSDVAVVRRGCHGHRYPWAVSTASRIQSYPRDSSSSASSRPPERTIRPSISTCTKSGVM